MEALLFVFLLNGAPFVWYAWYRVNKETDDKKVSTTCGIFLSLYTTALIYLLFSSL